MESVAGFVWNRWPACRGISGRNRVEYAAGRRGSVSFGSESSEGLKKALMLFHQLRLECAGAIPWGLELENPAHLLPTVLPKAPRATPRMI